MAEFVDVFVLDVGCWTLYECSKKIVDRGLAHFLSLIFFLISIDLGLVLIGGMIRNKYKENVNSLLILELKMKERHVWILEWIVVHVVRK